MFSINFTFFITLLFSPVFADAVIIDSSGNIRGADQKPSPPTEEKKISVDFQKADIHAVMRFLAKTGDTNIILDDSIQGTITIRLEGVSWTEAFTAVLWSKSLVAVPMESMYLVSPNP